MDTNGPTIQVAARRSFHCPPWDSSCAPFALSRLLGVPVRAIARRIYDAGGDHRSVTADVMQRVLAPHGIKQALFFTRRQPDFHSWRPRAGYWALIVTAHGASGGHCITLKDGPALDNGWVMFGGGWRLRTVRVHAAWQISKL